MSVLFFFMNGSSRTPPVAFHFSFTSLQIKQKKSIKRKTPTLFNGTHRYYCRVSSRRKGRRIKKYKFAGLGQKNDSRRLQKC